MTTLAVITILLLALFGAPLFVIMFLSTALAYSQADIDLINIFIMMGDMMDKPYLMPIPLFTLAGFLLAKSQAPKRLVSFAEALCGWMPGGLAIVSVVTCVFFTTFTGASGVTIIALGGLLLPLLLTRGYSEKFSCGLITSSGSLGLMFFPALPVFIYVTVYSLATDGRNPLSPEHIFLAGFFPGLLMMGLLIAYSVRYGIKLNIARQEFSMSKLWQTFKGAFWEISLPVWIIIALQSGQIGMSEIAVCTVTYLLFVEMIVYRDIHPFNDFSKVVFEAMQLVGAIVVILAITLGYNNYLIDAQIPQAILAWIQHYVTSPLLFLVGLNIFLLIIGCLMDIFSAMVAVLPLLIPLALAYGIAPEHLAIIFLANLEIGYLTPPVGMNLFISSLHFDRPILQICKHVLPFIALLAIALILITYVPALSTWLPSVFLEPTEIIDLYQPGEDDWSLEQEWAEGED